MKRVRFALLPVEPPDELLPLELAPPPLPPLLLLLPRWVKGSLKERPGLTLLLFGVMGPGATPCVGEAKFGGVNLGGSMEAAPWLIGSGPNCDAIREDRVRLAGDELRDAWDGVGLRW